MSKVYHDRMFPSTMIGRTERRFPDDFDEVAECATEDLNDIYRLTNHIDQAWWLNDGVRKVVDGQVRSTSVGDVVVLSDGTAHVVAAMGWTAIGKVNEGPLPLAFTAGFLGGQT